MAGGKGINRAPQEDERVELRWLRPDGTEAVDVVMRYVTLEEATHAVDACLTALEEVRRARTRSHVAARNSSVGTGDGKGDER